MAANFNLNTAVDTTMDTTMDTMSLSPPQVAGDFTLDSAMATISIHPPPTPRLPAADLESTQRSEPRLSMVVPDDSGDRPRERNTARQWGRAVRRHLMAIDILLKDIRDAEDKGARRRGVPTPVRKVRKPRGHDDMVSAYGRLGDQCAELVEMLPRTWDTMRSSLKNVVEKLVDSDRRFVNGKLPGTRLTCAERQKKTMLEIMMGLFEDREHWRLRWQEIFPPPKHDQMEFQLGEPLEL